MKKYQFIITKDCKDINKKKGDLMTLREVLFLGYSMFYRKNYMKPLSLPIEK